MLVRNCTLTILLGLLSMEIKCLKSVVTPMVSNKSNFSLMGLLNEVLFVVRYGRTYTFGSKSYKRMRSKLNLAKIIV